KRLIDSEDERIKVFIEETEEISKTFQHPRKSFILDVDKTEDVGSLMVVVYAKGRVSPLVEANGEGEVVNILDVPFSEGLFMVSNKGKVYWIAGSQALHGSKVSFKESDERIIGAFVRHLASDRIILATKAGYVKKIPLADFEYKAQGMSIIKFSVEGDEVVRILQSPEDGDLIIFTYGGRALRFPISQTPPATAGSKGVMGIKLERGDWVNGIRAVKDFSYLLVITDDGSIKKVSVDEISARGRGTKGVDMLGSSKGNLVDLIPIEEIVEIMVATQMGKVFYDRIDQKEMPLSRREHKAKKRWTLENDKVVRVVITRYEAVSKTPVHPS
ncbi:MAG: DNA gyrase C-terminal beta-propeller domain-containing protein, partial [Aquificaceae bacterium]